MDNPKVYVKNNHRFGNAVFAKEKISKDEVIAEFDGKIYNAEDPVWDDAILCKELSDHCIQFSENMWRDSNGLARQINHSCEPNCGIKDLFKIVAMRDIEAGEEISWDYEMSEKQDLWEMECHCGKPNCRGRIGNNANLPSEIRKKYNGYISGWLENK